MKIDPGSLANQLKSGLKPVYIVSGDEHLLVQEACTLIRASATAAGYTERLVFDIDSDARWQELNDAASALSLFASQRILEVRLPKGKPGEVGKKALLAYADNPSADDLLLLVTARLEKRTLSSAWFKALDSIGAHLPLWPVSRQQFPRWIEQRLMQAGLSADREAVILMSDLVDGNLLAAIQEIEKLKLAHGKARLTAENIRNSVADSSRFTLFTMIDTALSGDARTACKMLRGLQSEGSEPLGILWGLVREVRQLGQIATTIERGSSPARAMQGAHVWQSRQKLVGAALQRLSRSGIERIVQDLAGADLILKGASTGNGWDRMERAILKLARIPGRQKTAPA